jgi:hypothetical protein
MPTCIGLPAYQEVGRWDVNKRQVTGNCPQGYLALTNLVFISPDCQVGGGCSPTPTPTPSPTPTPTPTPTPFGLSSVHVSATGLVCCTQTDDTDIVQIFTMGGDGLTGFATNLGVDLEWVVSTIDNGNGTYTVLWTATLTNSGNQCDQGVVHTFSGVRTQNYADAGQSDDTGTDCETCHDGADTEPGFRCSSAYCGAPYGICNQLWLFNLFGYGVHVSWTPAPR